MTSDLTLTELEHLLAVRPFRGISYEDAGAIMRTALQRLRRAHDDAAAAAHAPNGDVRPVLRRYVRECAVVHGRSPAEQVAAFTTEGNQVFMTLALLGWGIGFDVED